MEETNTARTSKPMNLRLLIALSVIIASFCPLSEAQTDGLTPGTVLSWGAPAILWPYSQPGTRFQAIAAGGNHSLALKSDGTVAAWGNNSYGQSTVPANLTGVIAIAAGGEHSLALKSDGTVVGWGAGGTNSGVLYDYGQSLIPAGLTGVIAISAGYNHSLAIVSPTPALSIFISGTNVLVAWPATAAGYRLEITASLSPSVIWNPVTTMANLFGNRYELTLPITTGAQFF